MKSKSLLAAMLPVSAILFSLGSCTKEDNSTPNTPLPEPTKLSCTLKNANGNPAVGALVTLYSSESDYENRTNPIASSTANSSGIVLFSNLNPIKYSFLCQDGCENNINVGHTTLTPLVENMTNNIIITLSKTGILSFVNTSSDPYAIYVNGSLTINSVQGGASTAITDVLTGNYTVRVLQLSGYILTPTDITYTGTLSCGGTLTTTFP